MNMRSLIAASFAALFSLSLVAQNCPNQRTKSVPGSVVFGPANSCMGIDFSYAGLRVTQAATSCPTYALITPDHDTVETYEGTKVESVGITTATLITFSCKKDYFLWIFPDGAQCVVDNVRASHTLNLLVTKGC